MTYQLVSYSVGVVELHNVQSERVSKSGNVMVYPIPGENSNETLLVDLGGCTEEISITGVETFADEASRNTFASKLRGFVTGGQSITGATTYYSDLLCPSGTVVVVESVNIEFEAGNPLMLKYDVRMYVGNLI